MAVTADFMACIDDPANSPRMTFRHPAEDKEGCRHTVVVEEFQDLVDLEIYSGRKRGPLMERDPNFSGVKIFFNIDTEDVPHDQAALTQAFFLRLRKSTAMS